METKEYFEKVMQDQKWEMSAVMMGEKMMTGIAKKISGYNL